MKKGRRTILRKLPSAHRRLVYGFLAIILVVSGFFWWRPQHASATTDTFTTSGNWVVPAGVTSADFEAWGAGGAGAGSSVGSNGQGGGAGGQYAIKHLTGLNASDNYTVTVAGVNSGGTGAGNTGGDSGVVSPSSSQVVLAKGGAPGTVAGGGAGSTTGGIGDTVFKGGNGAVGATGNSGGGGGGAGSSGNGGNASSQTAGTGTSSNGGNGGTGVTSNGNGGSGSNYGGGGAGAFRSNGPSRSGGGGAQGLVTVTYTANSAPSAPSLASPAQPQNGSTGILLTGYVYEARAADPEGDYLKYEFITYDSSNCTGTVMEDANQSSSQTGWSGQDAGPGSNTAYAGNSTESSSTMAQHTYGGTTLTANHTYSWKAAATDPGGSTSQGSFSACASFTTNAIPAAPTLGTPSSGATGISITPSFTLNTTDADSDYLEYRVYLYQSDCSTVVGSSPFDETSSQTGWSGQDAGPGSNTAYVGSSTLAGSTTATYTYQGTLSNNTTYCWKADAIDPAGTNTFSSTSATQLFTTVAGGGTEQVNIGGGVNINGGTNIY